MARPFFGWCGQKWSWSPRQAGPPISTKPHWTDVMPPGSLRCCNWLFFFPLWALFSSIYSQVSCPVVTCWLSKVKTEYTPWAMLSSCQDKLFGQPYVRCPYPSSLPCIVFSLCYATCHFLFFMLLCVRVHVPAHDGSRWLSSVIFISALSDSDEWQEGAGSRSFITPGKGSVILSIYYSYSL